MSQKKKSQGKKSQVKKSQVKKTQTETEVKVKDSEVKVKETRKNIFDSLTVPESLGVNLRERQTLAFEKNRSEIEREFNERASQIESQLCAIGETDLIDQSLKKTLSLIIAKYIETVSAKVWSVSDFDSLDRETLRDYVKTCESFFNLSLTEVLTDLQTLRELREREQKNRVFLKTLLSHFLADSQSVPKKNIDSGQSFGQVWSETVQIVSD